MSNETNNTSSLYIGFTNDRSYRTIKRKMNNSSNLSDSEIQRYNHTLFVTHTSGLPNNVVGSANMYLGNQLITDIVTLNQFSNIRIVEDSTTGYLTVYDENNEVDILIGNGNKLYIYCKYNEVTTYTYFNIYYYSDSAKKYIPITKNGVTTSQLNFVNSPNDLENEELWQPKTFVYYEQDT